MPKTKNRIRAVLIAGIALSFLLPASRADAHAVNFNVSGKIAKIDTKKDPSKHKFVFKSTRDILINPVHDPAVNGSKLLVRWTGANAGRTELIELDPALWTGLGNPAGSKGYKYTDKNNVSTAVKRVTYKPGNNGGSLIITGGGDKWPWEVDGPVDSVEVYFGVYSDTDPNDLEWYCSDFGGDVKKNETGLFLSKNAPAPGLCPTEVCGNGVIEGLEECDDGNLDETDGCIADCEISDCVGTSYDHTWDAVQDQIFAASGCTQFVCHGATAQGGLDLTPANAYANIVSVASTISSLSRIVPGDARVSFLYHKLATATLGEPASVPGAQMPTGGLAPVDTNRLAGLREWIRAGAPKTGTVLGTESLFDGCFGEPTPNKIPPLEPPPAGEGIQFYAPPWVVPANDEDEVCYATRYDLNGQVPLNAQTPCPPEMGGPLRTCIRIHDRLLAQDPQSHHSIIQAYIGAHDWTHPGWGAWSCLGGVNEGTSCDPTQLGVPAAAGGAECGTRSACASAVSSTVACLGWGPPDMGFSINGQGTPNSPRIGGSQESYHRITFPDGVFGVVPIQGFTVWNSHGFNLTPTDTTIEQYHNMWFADTTDANAIGTIFDSDDIFVMSVPQFETREYCRTYTLPADSFLFELDSHTHKRGVLFRIWGPPQTPCSGGGCTAPGGAPIYVSTEYNDPVQLLFDPPVDHTGDGTNDRTYKYCALYDNGATDIQDVKRRSTSPEPPLLFVPGGPCSAGSTRCIGGPNHNALCSGNHSACDSSPGAGDGDCDACRLIGGVTVEDEMFILLGSHYTSSASQAFLAYSDSLLD
ncbi:MAG: hypothetical protein P8R42_29390 [Candidatus Binatia bacterium]|nr:hypothetical protein [Candidatus Binatia bacterium]